MPRPETSRNLPGLGPFTAVALMIVAGLAGCGEVPPPHQAIIGKWKSNEKLTLMSVDRVEVMSPQTRAFLRDDFFGHLVIHIDEKASRTTHARDDFDSGLEPYHVVEVTDDYVRIRAWSNFFKNYDTRTLYLSGDCYYVMFEGFQFREYFCKDT